MVQGDLWVVLGHLGHHPPPQAGGLQHIGLVHTGHVLAALHGHVKGHLGNPADLLLGILLDVVGGGAQVCVLHALFPEVDAAGELPNHHDVQAAGQNFRLQGGGVRQLFKEQGGAEVGK